MFTRTSSLSAGPLSWPSHSARPRTKPNLTYPWNNTNNIFFHFDHLSRFWPFVVWPYMSFDSGSFDHICHLTQGRLTKIRSTLGSLTLSRLSVNRLFVFSFKKGIKITWFKFITNKLSTIFYNSWMFKYLKNTKPDFIYYLFRWNIFRQQDENQGLCYYARPSSGRIRIQV